jgi:hypothetical protein
LAIEINLLVVVLLRSTVNGFSRVSTRLQHLEDEVHNQQQLLLPQLTNNNNDDLHIPVPDQNLPEEDLPQQSKSRPSNSRHNKEKRSITKSATKTRSNDQRLPEREPNSDDELQTRVQVNREATTTKAKIKPKGSQLLREHIQRTRRENNKPTRDIYTPLFGGGNQSSPGRDPDVQFVFRGDNGNITQTQMVAPIPDSVRILLSSSKMQSKLFSNY